MEPVADEAGELLPFRRGDAIDRFTVLEQLGVGGMGVVVAAYDVTLDRKVAIKVLRPDRLMFDAELGRARLLREAQAMARLSHPNVITVHEVGTVGDQVFVAMELIEGETLSAWLARTPRLWREVVRMFVLAGRGLAEAHRAELVHRDFKPDNVLVSNDGAVRVTDFGLAGVAPGGPEAAREAMLAAPLTLTGTMMGTPAYMSPEQHRGEEVDSRSDQFSFCVALYEALYGVRPFAGESAGEVLEAICAGHLRAPEKEAPRWLRALIVRGLAARPEDRWPSMDALLEQLSRDPASARRRWLLGGGAAAATAAAAAAAWLMSSKAPHVEPCPPAWDKVASIWDGGARTKTRAAFLATGAPHADAVYGRVERALSARLSGWVGAHREICRATHVAGEQSAALMDLRMECLERARRQIEALPGVWQKSVNLDEAVRAALTVGDLEVCSDARVPSRPFPPPRDPEAVRQLEALRRALDRVATLRRAGQLETGLTEARKAAADARRLGYVPVRAEALHLNAELEAESADPQVGLGLFHQAFHDASEAHDDTRAAIILRELLHYAAWSDEDRGKGDTELLWKMAEAAVARVPGNEDLMADLLCTQGVVMTAQGKRSEAVEHLRRGVAMKEKLHGADALEVASCLHNLGGVLGRAERLDEARAVTERVLSIWERSLGPEHPLVPMALHNLSAMYMRKGDHEAAAVAGARALAIRSKILPAGHTDIAISLRRLALVRAAQERDDEARVLNERAVRMWKAASVPNPPLAAANLRDLANLAVRRGEAATARKLFESALPAFLKAWGEDHRDFAINMVTLGDIRLLEKDPAGARAAHGRALVLYRKAPQDHRGVASAMKGLGEVALFEKKHAEAVGHFERARDTLEQDPAGPDRFLLVPILTDLGRAHLGAGHRTEARAILEEAVATADANGASSRFAGARARFQLARVLWEAGERARAVDVARTARGVLAGRREVGEMDRWLRKRQPR